MMEYEFFAKILIPLLKGLPIYIVYLVGFILAGIHIRKHPKVFIIACVAIGLLLVATIVFHLISAGMNIYLMKGGKAGDAVAATHGAIWFVFNIIQTIAFALLLYAIFAGRSQLPNTKIGAS